jgi:tetratricopeptide (TPR) repeat protein
MTRRKAARATGLAIALALATQCKRDEEKTPSVDPGSKSASGESLATTIGREQGAAWYGEGATLDHAWERAHDLLKRVAESKDATAQDLVNLACAKLKLHQTETEKQAEETPLVKELCKRAVEMDPKLADPHYVLGVVLMDREGDAAAALAEFKKALELAPEDVPTNMRVADSLNESGQRDAAIEMYKKIKAKGPEFTGSFYLPAIYRLARLLRPRNQGDDRKLADELLDEHRRLTASGASNPSEEDIKLGNFGRVKPPLSSGAPAAAPTNAPSAKFEAQPALLTDECATVASIQVADLDSDLKDDLLVAGADASGKGAVWALLQDEKAAGGWKKTKLADGNFTRAIAVDLENEYAMDVLLFGPDGVKLLAPVVDADQGEWKGTWSDVSAQLPKLPKQILDVQPVDFGHDGNVDLAFATNEGVKLVRNDGVQKDQDTKARTGPIQLKDVTADVGFPSSPVAWVAIEDVDCDQDVDLIFGGPGATTIVASNLRKGRFELLGPEKTGLPKEIARKPLLADLDHDGVPDMVVLGASGGGASFLRNKTKLGSAVGAGTFEPAKPLAADLAPLAGGACTLAELDGNGELDLVGVGADGSVAARLGSLLSEKGATLPIGGKCVKDAAPLLADLDDDGDLDFVGPSPDPKGGVEIRRSNASTTSRTLLLALRGQKDNRQSIGAIVEVRARNHYERRFALERKQLFGLGNADHADLARITWPNGVLQHVIEPKERVLAKLIQKEGLVGSCPFLYTWNGKHYEFVSDVLGTTPLGLPMTESMYVPPNHDELVRVTGAQLAPVDGEYRMQFTEELRETTYLDRAQLWVVDHPADVELHPEERFSIPFPPRQKIHAMRKIVPLVKAVDQKGRDWTAALAKDDGVHAVPFDPMDSRYLGLVTGHVLDLTLPDAVKTAKRVRLLMTGWLHWTDASVNVLADRNHSIAFVPPLFSVPDGKGGWTVANHGEPVGFPAGKTKTMVLDVSEMLNRADPRLRIYSTIRLYWDSIRVAIDESDDDPPTTVTKLEPKSAKLWHRGFSAPLEEKSLGDARASEQPTRFDWDHVETTPRWNQHRGMLTRFGEVKPLLASIDDQFVILSAGDAIDLRFDASQVAPPKPGMSRTFLLFLDGWAKDADPNTQFSQTVEPLPFHAMSAYPYAANERYPDDDAHRDYLLEWNTRPALRLIPDLSPSRAAASPNHP